MEVELIEVCQKVPQETGIGLKVTSEGNGSTQARFLCHNNTHRHTQIQIRLFHGLSRGMFFFLEMNPYTLLCILLLLSLE